MCVETLKNADNEIRLIKYETFCKHCGKEIFTYDINDIYAVEVAVTKAGRQKTKENFKIKCPTCGNPCKIAHIAIPKSVQICIRKRN